MSVVSDACILANGMIDDVYTVMRITKERPSMFVRRRMKHLVTISWGVTDQDLCANGRIGEHTIDQMQDFELRLANALEPSKIAMLMIVATKPTVREWDWYTRDVEEMLKIHNQDFNDIYTSEIEVSHQIDAGWKSHANALEMVQRQPA